MPESLSRFVAQCNYVMTVDWIGNFSPYTQVESFAILWWKLVVHGKFPFSIFVVAESVRLGDFFENGRKRLEMLSYELVIVNHAEFPG